MQLLTPDDLALFEELVIKWAPTHHEAIYDRIKDTAEYLARIEFATPEEIESARQTYCWDDDAGIQVDDDARVSRCDDENASYWVSAWVLIGEKQ